MNPDRKVFASRATRRSTVAGVADGCRRDHILVIGLLSSVQNAERKR